jgi:hypothetical protein
MVETPMAKKVQFIGILMVIVGLLASGLAIAVAQADQAAAVVGKITSFYDWYLDYIHSGDNGIRNPLSNRAYHDSPALTPELIAEIDAMADAEGGFHYDPFLCAQDFPLSFSVEVVRVEADEATALVREDFNNPDTNDLTLRLINTGDNWQINSIVCGETITPVGVVEDFYDWYLYEARMEPATQTRRNPLMDGTYQAYPLLSENLVTTVADIVTSGEMHADPLLCAQDIPQYVDVDILAEQDDRAEVLVRAHFAGNPHPAYLTAVLTQSTGQWLLDEIQCDARPEAVAQVVYDRYAAFTRYSMTHDNMYHPLSEWGNFWQIVMTADLYSSLMDALASSVSPADPVLCAQDIPHRFEVERTAFTENTAIVTVSGVYPAGPDSNSRYPLAEVTLENSGGWQVSSIDCITR